MPSSFRASTTVRASTVPGPFHLRRTQELTSSHDPREHPAHVRHADRELPVCRTPQLLFAERFERAACEGCLPSGGGVHTTIIATVSQGSVDTASNAPEKADTARFAAWARTRRQGCYLRAPRARSAPRKPARRIRHNAPDETLAPFRAPLFAATHETASSAGGPSPSVRLADSTRPSGRAERRAIGPAGLRGRGRFRSDRSTPMVRSCSQTLRRP